MKRKYTINPAKPPGRPKGIIRKMAEQLGISRQAMYERLKKARYSSSL